MDLSSQRQFIQRADNVHLRLALTSQYTFYTAPSGGDFDFVVVESLIASERGNQQTTLDITVTHDATEYSLFKEEVVKAYEHKELLSRSLILTQGEIIKITASHADKVDMFMSIVEYGKGD
jgi:hypothetical protein